MTEDDVKKLVRLQEDIKQLKKTKVNILGKNHLEIIAEEGVYLQSYSSIIVFQSNDGKTYLDKKTWNYSRTTAGWRNKFLNETTKETEKKIASGEYQLIDLN